MVPCPHCVIFYHSEFSIYRNKNHFFHVQLNQPSQSRDRNKSNRNSPKLCRFELSGTNRINSKLHRIEVRQTDLVKQELKRKIMYPESKPTEHLRPQVSWNWCEKNYLPESKKTYLVQNLSGMKWKPTELIHKTSRNRSEMSQMTI